MPRGDPAQHGFHVLAAVDNNSIACDTYRAKRSERAIRLASHDGAYEISNGGPGIERRLADQIFDYGMTTKVGGEEGWAYSFLGKH
jgi:sensor histidine kinase regulating citrate/malate metabolism